MQSICAHSQRPHAVGCKCCTCAGALASATTVSFESLMRFGTCEENSYDGIASSDQGAEKLEVCNCLGTLHERQQGRPSNLIIISGVDSFCNLTICCHVVISLAMVKVHHYSLARLSLHMYCSTSNIETSNTCTITNPACMVCI